MATPSWLPAWPAGWTDWEAVYKRLVPHAMPRGLMSPDGEQYGDWRAIGETLGQVKKLMEWVLSSYFPFRDTNALQLSYWEDLLRMGVRSTVADRMAWVTARVRQVGTATVSKDKAIMVGAWGSTDGSFLSIHYNDPVVAATYGAQPTDDLARREQQHLHFYPTAEDVAPNWEVAEDLIARAKPTWATWSVGKKRYFEYGNADCGWGRGVWNG